MRITSTLAIALAFGMSLGGNAHAIDGEEVYRSGSMPPCFTCHDTGTAGAPKTGDAGTWGDRLDKDTADLVASVMSGQGVMPAYQDRISEDEARAAVEWMLEQTKE